MGVKGQEKAMQTSSSMRGQMGLRSGPLAPTSAKLTTQYLVLDHMTNHYNKITKAKSAIDNKPPRSMSTSQKARDKKTRDQIAKTGRRPASASRPSTRPHTTTGYYHDDDIYDEALWGDPDDEEGMLIHNIMRTTLHGNSDFNNSQYPHTSHDPSGFDSYARTTRQRPSSARSLRSATSGVSRTMVQVPQKKGTYDGDVLDKRAHVFTDAKPFTPRTLKTDRKSRLSQYKYYNKVPPKAKEEKPRSQSPVEASRDQPKESAVPDGRPQPKPRQQRLDRTREGPVTMNSLMFETLHSRDFSNSKDSPNPDVPKLDISMDLDHRKWVEEQASKAKLRQNNDTLKSSLHEDPYDTSVDFGKTGEMSLTYGTLGSTKMSRQPMGSSRKITPEQKLGTKNHRSVVFRSARDEEAMYVKFMREVTNEVLDRGIYTDRALRQVFKAHIARNKGHLDELKMHQILDDIRHQLNIPRYDINDETSLTMTQETPSLQNGTDSSLDKYLHQDRYDGRDTLEAETMNGTLEASMKSKNSRVSTDPSADTYNFKSTEDDDVYSTIRSDMNNTATLSGTQALRTYQASINEQEELEEGEIISEPRRKGSDVASSVRVTEVHDEDVKDDHSKKDHDWNDDEYDDDVYEDDGDDEDDEDDGPHTTEPTATYRTDDDDDF